MPRDVILKHSGTTGADLTAISHGYLGAAISNTGNAVGLASDPQAMIRQGCSPYLRYVSSPSSPPPSLSPSSPPSVVSSPVDIGYLFTNMDKTCLQAIQGVVWLESGQCTPGGRVYTLTPSELCQSIWNVQTNSFPIDPAPVCPMIRSAFGVYPQDLIPSQSLCPFDYPSSPPPSLSPF